MDKPEASLQAVLALRVRELREARGITQSDFALMLGVHRTYLGGIERGERNLTLKSVEQLAESLGVSPADLLL